MFDWVYKKLVNKWIRELELNIQGMRKMANDYREQGGFKEVVEVLAKAGAEDLIPNKLIDEGRKAELRFAEACEQLAKAYDDLLMYVKSMIKQG